MGSVSFLLQILGWCHDLDIREVTVYAFSIENFKRPEEEVNGLLSLAREKFAKLLAERFVANQMSLSNTYFLPTKIREKLTENGVCIRIFGETSMLPIELQKLLAETVLATRSNTKAFLNVCFAYTSRAEMTSAVSDIVSASDDGVIHETDVTADLLRNCLWGCESDDPDLLIRTSGESRLSDFILWQSGYSVIAFVQKLWPEFTIWDLFKAVFFYQRHQQDVTHAMHQYRHRQAEVQHIRDSEACRSRREATVQRIKAERLKQLQQLVKDVAVECG